MKITISDIADIAGVSTATVSKVVNDKVHDIGSDTVTRVKKILTENNYVPNHLARSMKTNKTQTIGLVIPDIRNAFFTDIARGAEDESSLNGYTIFFGSSDDKLSKEIQYLKTLEEKRVDGILIVGSNERDRSLEFNLDLKTPSIAIDRDVHYNCVVGNIVTDNTEGAYEAVQYLIDQGHESILHLAGPKSNVVSIGRLNGYIKALKDNRLNILEENIIFGEFDTNSGYNRIKQLVNLDLFTAIFCANDMIAFGVINALKEIGVAVPEQISVVGVDDVEFSKITSPGLTTVNQSAYELGKISVKMMIDYLNGNKIPKTKILKQVLTIRNSVTNIIGEQERQR